MLKVPTELIKRFFVILKEHKLIDVIILSEDTSTSIFSICLIEYKKYNHQTLYLVDMVSLLPILYKTFYNIQFTSFSNWNWRNGISLVYKDTTINQGIDFVYVQLESFFQLIELEDNYFDLILYVNKYESYIYELYLQYEFYSYIKKGSKLFKHIINDKIFLNTKIKVEKNLIKLIENYPKECIKGLNSSN